MKTLDEIKQLRAYEMDYANWEEFVYSVDNPDIVDGELDNIAKMYALEVAKEALKNASKNAMLSCDGIIDEFFTFFGEGGCSTVGVHDESILSETNIPQEVKL